MLLIGLLLVALVCLTLGIMLASGVWLIASLAVTVLAGLLLFALRGRIGKKPAVHSAPAAETTRAAGAAVPAGLPVAAPAAAPASFADVLAATADLPGGDPSAAAAAAAVLADEAPAVDEPEVWVVDGEPDYHARRCPVLTAAAEPIPRSQAVEDGFTPCGVCGPESALVDEPAEPPAPLAEPNPGPDFEPRLGFSSEPVASALTPAVPVTAEVWVVDGSPHFHVRGCSALGEEAEAIPYAQAVEDGFLACPACDPEAGLASGLSADLPVAVSSYGGGADGSLTEVWVMDGHPDYHLVLCSVLDETAEGVPYDQAIEDGFTPCGLCDPESSSAFVPFQSVAEVAAAAEPQQEARFGEIAIEQVPEGSLADPVGATAFALDEAPDKEPAEAPDEALGQVPVAGPDDVWVEDGRPYYHAADCALVDATAEPVALAEAVEAGFEPCALCQEISFDTTVSLADFESAPEPAPAPAPEPVGEPAAEPEREPEPVSQPVPAAAPVGVQGDVWVVDGRPRYHRSDCLLVKGQSAVPVSRDQAVEDGFLPCSLCEPHR